MTLPSSGPLSLNDIQGEFGGSNPIGINEYYAGGGLVPAGTSGTYGAVPTSGQISIQNFYGTSNFVPVYIEDVFSTYLYNGNGSTQTINNGIDLAGKGGLVWIKDRTTAQFNLLFDTSRGANYWISSNNTNASAFNADMLQSFNSNGFGVGTTTSVAGSNYASWTFRKQPKFFDVVTYTGDGSGGGQAISHNLGATPGFVVVKRLTSGTSDQSTWWCWHRTFNTGQRIALNETSAAISTNGQNYFGNGNAAVDPTSTTVQIGPVLNSSAVGYVMYLFAHNAGGFGLTGTDNVISCGTTDGSKVTLGWEPQWILHKASNFSSNWDVLDTMRGMPWGQQARMLNPNLANAEAASSDTVNGQPYSPKLYADGFELGTIVGNHIYIAIRRGPMKTPTSGTSVFSPVSAIATGGTARTTGFPVDLQILAQKDKANYINTWAVDRLRGVSTTNSASGRYVFTNTTDAEATANAVTRDFGNTGYVDPNFFGSLSMIWWNFRRAPGFFDVVCYTGTGSATTQAHNLGVVPELIIVKKRNGVDAWGVWSKSRPLTGDVLYLQNTIGWDNNAGYFTSANPTASVFSVGASTSTNGSGDTYVAYLFASCPGVSKVGSYTGNGSSQTINCGFTGGARFVMIKRTDSAGNWWVWDTARGMTAGTDYRIPLNTTDADSNTNNVYTTTGGFEIVTLDATINASGGSYIYLAIA